MLQQSISLSPPDIIRHHQSQLFQDYGCNNIFIVFTSFYGGKLRWSTWTHQLKIHSHCYFFLLVIAVVCAASADAMQHVMSTCTLSMYIWCVHEYVVCITQEGQ